MQIENDIPLAPLTSLGIGGAARHLAHCTTPAQVCEALEWAGSRSLPVHVLGGGSNTIFADSGFDGLVLRVELTGVDIDDAGTTTEIRAAAGEDWDGLVARCIDADLVGLECLSGIPGFVGATPIQNVGAYGQEVSRVLMAVDAIECSTLQSVRIDAADCGFAYRDSRFKGTDRGRYIITGVIYQLERATRPQIRYPELQRRLDAAQVDLDVLRPGRDASAAIRDVVLSLRASKGMVVDPTDANTRSAGSFFLNPVLTQQQYESALSRWRSHAGPTAQIPSYPVAEATADHKVAAAWLVEQAGFTRGAAVDGAAVSDHHALALVSRSGREADLMNLARDIQVAVESVFGLRLRREPVRVAADGRVISPEDNEPCD
ncbi:MAG: UDP-N-acetylmuramate dehydrogenase [Gemmatimonadetes bacterium]|jgi:UDP-N-acetylmuramate dehydrogenase|nr:UDP-N-acetylmuramate dehydrogenase [Gemmatimonadota bacterium]MBT7860132.1 UDP-N-acetylmuramate dehydrogenase [Gemmatimonadota bacterium]